MFDTITFVHASTLMGAGLAIGFGAIGAALGEGGERGLGDRVGAVVADPVGISDHCPFASSNWPECTYLPLIQR